MNLAESIQERYNRVLDTIAAAAIRSGRRPGDVRVVVVSKAQPIEVVEAAIQCGIRVFGENYPEETTAKINALQGTAALEWHMIGHLQSRKARMVAESFDYLHSLDSLHLAEKLNRELSALSKSLPVLLEMNVSGEESKSGFSAWDEGQWAGLAEELAPLQNYSQLRIAGLMTMPPYFEDPEGARSYFARLHRLRDFLALRLPEWRLPELSMGTSGDFGVAVEEGATFVRIGQAILGPRPLRRV